MSGISGNRSVARIEQLHSCGSIPGYSLREALKALETVGVVETRHGLGSFVGRASLAPLIAGMAFNLVQSINQDTHTLRELFAIEDTVSLCARITRN